MVPKTAMSSLKSDLELDCTKFDPAHISEQTRQMNDAVSKVTNGAPKWWDIGAGTYRQMRANGETGLPKPVLDPSAHTVDFPSRDANRTISCRVIKPETGDAKGVFYHIHGGGWVLGSHDSQDANLKFLSNATDLIVISVGYRLAPEHPYPAPNEDCLDVAEYLIDHAETDFGAPLLFAGGESAGAHLTICTVLELASTRPEFAFRGLVLGYGAYDVSAFCPQAYHFKPPVPLILSMDDMKHFVEAYLPGYTADQRRDPKISPLWAELTKFKLPSALFLVGTSDCLLDDSVFMSAKWRMSGAEAILKVYPGGAHGFTVFDPKTLDIAAASRKDTEIYISERL